MSSFYGGKQGRTYHIVARYDCVSLNTLDTSLFSAYDSSTTYSKGDKVVNNGNYYVILVNDFTGGNLSDPTQAALIRGMVEQFQKGGAYTEANYGQYVLIDTIKNLNQKSNPENGLLFRRGFDYNQVVTTRPLETNYRDNNGSLLEDQYHAAWSAWVQSVGGGAIYIGQIVGPQGDTPEVIPKTWEQVTSHQDYVENEVSGSFTRGRQVDEQTQEVTYNDDIRVTYVSIRDTDGNIRGAWIAFDIPMTVFQAVVDPNTTPYSQFAVNRIQDDIDSQTGLPKDHPFYYKWQFTVPGGKHGTDLEQLAIQTGLQTKYSKTTDEQVDSEKTYYIKQDGQFVQVDDPQQEDLDEYYEYTFNETVDGDEYLTYSIREYNQNADGALTEHLGRWPYRVVNKIQDFQTERNYKTWQASSTYAEGDLIDLGPVLNQNDEQTGDEYIAVCVIPGTSGSVPDEQDPQTYSPLDGNTSIGSYVNDPDEEGQLVIGGVQWLVTTIPATAAASKIIVDYTAGQNDQIDFNQVDYIFVDGRGVMFAVYSCKPDVAYFLTIVDSIADINISDDGIVTITHKTGDIQTFSVPRDFNVNWSDTNSSVTFSWSEGGESQSTIGYVKQVTDIELINQNDITQTQKFVASYKGLKSENPQGENTGSSDISDPINNILDVQRLGDNLLILFSDPNMRNNIPQGKRYIKSWEDTFHNKTYENLVWYNFGPLGAQYHVAGVYSYSDLKGDSEAEDFSCDLSQGFGYVEGEQDKTGWLVTIPYTYIDQSQTPPVEIHTYKVYAYDYNDPNENGSYSLPDGTNTHWYEILSLADQIVAASSHIVVSQEINTPQEGSIYQDRSTLAENGVWFVVSGGGCSHG